MLADVLIVGAGPVGLMLAGELRLAGASVHVLERLAAPTGLSKALGLIGRAEDYLDMRGLLQRFRDRAPAHAPVLASLLHFGMIPLDIGRTTLDRKGLFIPQSLTEELLEQWALELGATLHRGVEVTELVEDTEGVTLTTRPTAASRGFRARFVVGCDGAHSIVRKLSGIGFPGAPPTTLLRLGDVKLTADGEKTPPFLVPLGDGYLRMITKEPIPDGFDKDVPMTLEELRESGRRVFGRDVPIAEARWLSRFTDASRQAERYRSGRVLLAGDAAHIHLPAGGPGLLTGIGDAMNLGWKLGAVIRGEAGDSLLDTYHEERHAVGRRVIMHTRAQGALTLKTDASLAMREIMTELTALPAVIEHVLRLLWQTDTSYRRPDDGAHPLTGRFVPDLSVTTIDGPRRVLELLRDGKALWLRSEDKPFLGECVAPYASRLKQVLGRADGPAFSAGAMLVRPDGHVAWAAAAEDLHEEARGSLASSLRRWLGGGETGGAQAS